MEPKSRVIETAQELFEDDDIPGQLALIKVNFQVLAKSFTALEERLPLAKSMKIIEDVKKSLQLKPFSTKMADVLKKNPGYE